MPPAVLAAAPAIIGAVGTIGGAVLASSAQKSATNKAVQAQTNATNQQLQLYREGMGQARDMYNSNFGVLAPYAANGVPASNALNALLNLPSAPPMTSPLAHAAATTPIPGATAPGAINPASLNPTTALQALGAYRAVNRGVV
jgi:type II secretory pathway pseudopilin PulG